MKALLPLVAAAGLLAACGSEHHCKNGYCDHGRNNERQYHHGSSEDALSDRSLGNTRGAHNEKRVGDYNTKDHWDHDHRVMPVAPAYVPAYGTRPSTYRPDGTYALPPEYEARGYQHRPSEDALSERSLGSSRGAHNEPMTHKDMNHDGDYDYTPYYAPRSTTWRYYHD